MAEDNGVEALTEAIGRYNDAWNAQDKRKDVYSDSVSVLRQVGLLETATGKPFRTKPLPLGKPRLESFDDIAGLEDRPPRRY